MEALSAGELAVDDAARGLCSSQPRSTFGRHPVPAVAPVAVARPAHDQVGLGLLLDQAVVAAAAAQRVATRIADNEIRFGPATDAVISRIPRQRSHGRHGQRLTSSPPLPADLVAVRVAEQDVVVASSRSHS